MLLKWLQLQPANIRGPSACPRRCPCPQSHRHQWGPARGADPPHPRLAQVRLRESTAAAGRRCCTGPLCQLTTSVAAQHHACFQHSLCFLLPSKTAATHALVTFPMSPVACTLPMQRQCGRAARAAGHFHSAGGRQPCRSAADLPWHRRSASSTPEGDSPCAAPAGSDGCALGCLPACLPAALSCVLPVPFLPALPCNLLMELCTQL